MRTKSESSSAIMSRLLDAYQPQAYAGVAEARAVAKSAPARELPSKPVEQPRVKKGESQASRNSPELLAAEQVNAVFGSLLLAGEAELDFTLPAPMPVIWQRVYCSDNPAIGWLGQGWGLTLAQSLRIEDDEAVLLDPQHREISFPLPQVGQSVYSPHCRITLKRSSALCFELIDSDLTRTLFELAAADATVAPLTAIIDANGNSTKVQYNSARKPARVLDSAGRILTLHFNPQNRLILVGELRSRGEGGQPPEQVVPLVHYDYDDGGDLIRVRNRTGQASREFAYRNHLLIRHSEPRGLVSEYEYSDYTPQGQVARNRNNTGQFWQFAYHPGESIVTDQLGRRQRFHFDAQHRLTGKTDALGSRTEQRLDDYGNVVSATDEAGRITRYRYDERSRLTRIEAPDGGVTELAYNSGFDKPTSITDAAGGVTAFDYDQHGKLIAVVDANGRRTEYRYNEQGLPIAVIDAAGGSRQLAYNQAGQLTAYTDCSGRTTQFDYDIDGRLIQARDPLGRCTRYRFDRLGHLLATIHPDGSEEQNEYDGLGRLQAHIDAGGRRTRYSLDLDGKPLGRTNALGHTLHYRYDNARRMTQVVNENGAVHAFSYDLLDRVVQETGFDGRVIRYRYDVSGLLLMREECGSPQEEAAERNDEIDARIYTVHMYDGAGRLIEQIVSRSTSPTQVEQLRTNYGYDALGRLTHARNAQAWVDLQYDAVGQLVAERITIHGKMKVLTHAYDLLGNRIRTVLPDGRTLTQVYDDVGHVRQIKLDGEVISDIERDEGDRETSRTQGALVSNLRYDQAGRVKSQVAQSLAEPDENSGRNGRRIISRQYDYDKTGNLVALNDGRGGRSVYRYDPIGRILLAAQPQIKEAFAFDPAHNILDPQGPTGSNGKIPGNRLIEYRDRRYAYDLYGNLSEKRIGRHTEIQLLWNGEHRLMQAAVTRNAQGEQPVTRTTRYGYDPFGRRLFKRDDSTITYFIWDGNRLLGELDDSHTRLYLYEQDSFAPLAQVESTAAAATGNSAASVLYFHNDHLGVPRELTDAQGQLCWSGAYRTWGILLKAQPTESDQGAQAMPAKSVPEPTQTLRFQGQYYDEETGLHYSRCRYYDPDCGRFISQDPAGLQGGDNLYLYAPAPAVRTAPLEVSSDYSSTAAALDLAHNRHGSGPRGSGRDLAAVYIPVDFKIEALPARLLGLEHDASRPAHQFIGSHPGFRAPSIG
jgi:RHS repeat-associated protein